MWQPPSHVRLLPAGLRVLRLSADRGKRTLLAEPEVGSAWCPLCDRPSGRVHSHYARTVSDLPWRGLPVTLKIRVRKFFCVFCDAPSCQRAIFCERLPDVAAHARKTGRLEAALLAIAFELGGEAGARLARELGLLVCPDVLLDRIRRAL